MTERLTPQDPVVQAETERMEAERMAELQAYAMKPEMDAIAVDREAAPKTPQHFVHTPGGESRLVGGEPILTTEQKQRHWELNGQAEHSASEVERLDKAVHDTSRELIERRVAQQMVHILTNRAREVDRR